MTKSRLSSFPVPDERKNPLALLRPDLDKVEATLTETVSSSDPFLSQVAVHLIDAGGKRLRPSLTVAASGAALAESGHPQIPDRVIKAAAAVELTHLGSLHHDDVIDEAAQRRNVPSVNARYGNAMAILSGDFLLARASSLVAGLGSNVAEVLASTIAELVVGQVREYKDLHNLDRTVDSYETSIEGKTASLLGTASRLGALVTGAPSQTIAALDQFGRAFGMAFQIRDDISDIRSTAEELGKPVGNDLLEGTYSLPTLLALKDPGVKGELRSLLGEDMSPDAVVEARDLIKSSDAIEQSEKRCSEWANKAADCLEQLAESEYRTALLGLVDTVR